MFDIRNFIAAFLILILAQFSLGQDQVSTQIDSLHQIINNPTSHDTSLAAAYVELSLALYDANPDTVLPLCQIARQICTVGISDGSSGEVKISLMSSLATALNNIGFIYTKKGNVNRGLEYYHKSLIIYKEVNDKEGMAYSFNNIGYIYYNQGIIDKGLEYFFLGLTIREELGDKKGKATSYNNIGSIYTQQGDIEMGMEYYHKSLTIYEEISNQKGMAGAYNSIGTSHIKQGEVSEGLRYFFLSLKIREEIEDKWGIATSYHNIGNELCNMDSMEEGMRYLKLGLRLAQENSFKERISDDYSTIGKWQLNSGQLEAALISGTEALKVARELGHVDYLESAAGLLSMVYRKQNKFKEALNMYEFHIDMKDSINNLETQKATIRQQTKYEFEKAALVKEQEEKEAARIVAEETSRRDNLQYSIILIAILTLFGGVLALGYINVSERMAEGIIFFSFLILFEFLLVLADPYIDRWSSGAPGIKLLFNAGIAALIFPAHAFFESKLKGKLVKK